MGGQSHAPAAPPPGETRYPSYRRLGGLEGRSGRMRKNSLPTAIRSLDCPARSESLYCIHTSTLFKFLPHFFFKKEIHYIASHHDFLLCPAHKAPVHIATDFVIQATIWLAASILTCSVVSQTELWTHSPFIPAHAVCFNKRSVSRFAALSQRVVAGRDQADYSARRHDGCTNDRHCS